MTEPSDTSAEEIYYLSSILRHLKEFPAAAPGPGAVGVRTVGPVVFDMAGGPEARDTSAKGGA